LVKASGSIKHLSQARELIAAGASLLGTSAGIEIISGLSNSETKSY
jgi:deoxyribose-phosphate aldolase